MAKDTSDKDLVVLVDDDAAQRELMSRWLVEEGYRVESFGDGQSAVERLAGLLPQVVCLDLHMPGWDGIETMAQVLELFPRMPVVFMTQDSEVDRVVEAMRQGAYDYLTKPADRRKLVTTVRNAAAHNEMSVRLAQLETEVGGGGYEGMIGVSASMRGLFRQIEQLAGSEISVLIRGESGTGKELVARALHARSSRSARSLVAVNCAAIPETLQESELFGHEKGAFSGADQRRVGRIEESHGGTLFLDEVAEMSASLQAKLLRVLQEKRFRRVGGTEEIESDFRLVAASHRKLEEEVTAGRFREDLFYRIAVFELEIPPLRDRVEDIGQLAEGILARLFPMQGYGVTLDVLGVLEGYGWPGNVRELQNTLQRASVVCEDRMISIGDLPARIRRAVEAPGPEGADLAPAPSGTSEAADSDLSNSEPAGVRSLEELERHAILDALERTGGNRTEMARQLGIGRTTLYRKLRDLGVS